MDLWAGRTSVGELVEPGALWSKAHFPTFLAVLTLTAGTAGNLFMGYLRRSDQEYRQKQRDRRGREQAMEAMQVLPLAGHHGLE
jgi:hypothetical protein